MDNQINLLPVSETISTSWEKIKGTKGSIWAALAIVFIIMFCIGFISGLLKNVAPLLSAAVDFIGQIINFLLQMGMLYIGIKRAFDLPVSYRLMFRTFESNITLRVIGLYILQILIFIIPLIITFVGIVLYNQNQQILLGSVLVGIAILAMIYLAIRMMVAMGLVIDKGVNPWSAIKMSFQATHGNFWRIVAIFLIQFLILVVSIIPLGIGLIWTLPFSFIIYGMIYKKLTVNM